MTMRLAFMGTPEFAVPVLRAALAAGHEIAAVYTQPPRPAGRGLKPWRSPVHEFALAQNIEVRTPASLKQPDAQTQFAALGLDAAIVVAYGLLLPGPVLEAPRLGCYNLHASALPRWRGAAPIQRAIMAGDTETAATVMRMDAGLDTGPVCLVDPVEITPQMTAGDLHDLLADRGARLMAAAMGNLENDQLECTAQPQVGATYAAKIDKSETRINWHQPAAQIHNHIRGLSPHPGAWFEIEGRKGRLRIKVLAAQVTQNTDGATPGTVLADGVTIACADGAVRLGMVQRAGGAVMPAGDFVRGTPLGTHGAL
ncbi:MAG: methionyl-tRNA formyltransferase [Alphaproteobacteria bacterium]